MKRSTSVADKPSDEQVADAMRALEPGLADLVLMTRIVTDLLERLLGRADGKADGKLEFKLEPVDRDAALFGLGDVEARALGLKAAYYAALDGM